MHAFLSQYSRAFCDRLPCVVWEVLRLNPAFCIRFHDFAYSSTFMHTVCRNLCPWDEFKTLPRVPLLSLSKAEWKAFNIFYQIKMNNTMNIPCMKWFSVDIQLKVLIFPQEASTCLVHWLALLVSLRQQNLPIWKGDNSIIVMSDRVTAGLCNYNKLAL